MNQKKGEYVKIPSELLKKVDDLVETLDLQSREAFVEAALRRLIDRYRLLKAEELAKNNGH